MLASRDDKSVSHASRRQIVAAHKRQPQSRRSATAIFACRHLLFVGLLTVCVAGVAVASKASETTISGETRSPEQCVGYYLPNVKAIWSEELCKASDRYAINNEAIRDVRGQIEQLKQDISWFGIDARKEVVLDAGSFAQATLTASKLADNLMQLDPEYKALRRPGWVLEEFNRLVLRKLRETRGKVEHENFKRSLGEKAADAVVDSLKKAYNPVGQSVKTVKDLAADIKHLAEMKGDYRRFVADANASFRRLDGYLTQYETAARKAGARLDTYAQIESAVRQYCGERREPGDALLDRAREATEPQPPRTDADEMKALDHYLETVVDEQVAKSWDSQPRMRFGFDATALISEMNALLRQIGGLAQAERDAQTKILTQQLQQLAATLQARQGSIDGTNDEQGLSYCANPAGLSPQRRAPCCNAVRQQITVINRGIKQAHRVAASGDPGGAGTTTEDALRYQLGPNQQYYNQYCR